MACKRCQRECSRADAIQQYDRALLFRRLATLQTDIVLFEDMEQLRWNGPMPAFAMLEGRLDAAVTEKKRISRPGVAANVKVSEASSISEGVGLPAAP